MKTKTETRDASPSATVGATRTERDSLGDVEVPAAALFGAQTQRAVLNFPVSALRMPRRLIRALALLKRAAAEVNKESGALPVPIANAIIQAADEVAAGHHDGEFPVDVFQTGSGTSSNMNTNEVIANRAIQLLGGVVGSKSPVHPNDHVNKGQSSNDVFPTAVNIAAAEATERDLLPALRMLGDALSAKVRAFDHVVKLGRTHLMDAVPIRLGQEFSGYSQMITNAQRRIGSACAAIRELPLGGTAVGTGLGSAPDFAPRVIALVAAEIGIPLGQAPNLFEALSTHDNMVELSAALRSAAVSLTKIANDIRWLSSGPRGGIAELRLPELQPGSSIMPGKVNPVMAEMLLMICAQVVGNDATVAWGGAAGNFELNTMTPVMAFSLLQSIDILATGCGLFESKCVNGIQADEVRCRDLVERSVALVTALAPRIGYDAAAALAHESTRTGKTIRELAHDRNILPKDELERLLDVAAMTGQPRDTPTPQ
ncbi:MAG: class II fumarate hydratase [Deltaproteobacteria bacterium]|nr:class II fumarate hydratase [Deltaproteobacteria bacterium]